MNEPMTDERLKELQNKPHKLIGRDEYEPYTFEELQELFDEIHRLRKEQNRRLRELQTSVQNAKGTHWYKNCRSQRARGAKICADCPLRTFIEGVEC